MSTEKIDEALGLGEGGIDKFLEDLTIDNTTVGDKLQTIDEKVKQNVNQIDSQIAEYNKNGIVNIDVSDINSSLNEIKELIEISKGTIKHVYESIVTSELVDSELVQALGNLMESSHLTIGEYIQLYRDRMSFYDKVRFEMMKHQQKRELIEYKHKLDMEKMKMKQDSESTPVQNMMQFNQEDITRMMHESNEVD